MPIHMQARSQKCQLKERMRNEKKNKTFSEWTMLWWWHKYKKHDTRINTIEIQKYIITNIKKGKMHSCFAKFLCQKKKKRGFSPAQNKIYKFYQKIEEIAMRVKHTSQRASRNPASSTNPPIQNLHFSNHYVLEMKQFAITQILIVSILLSWPKKGEKRTSQIQTPYQTRPFTSIWK